MHENGKLLKRRATGTDESYIGRESTVKHGNYHLTNKHEILSNTSDLENMSTKRMIPRIRKSYRQETEKR